VPYFSVKIPDTYEGSVRLDKYIASLPNGMNRSKLKSGVLEIVVNGKKSKLSEKVSAGDKIDIEWEDNIPTDILPENIPLSVLYENENVTVVNKKQGIVTHPAAGNWSGTLVNALLYHWGRDSVPQQKDVSKSILLAQRRPGIVHRLDKDTSGIIITAKNRYAEEWLQKQFQDRFVRKDYIAIVTGRPPHDHGIIQTHIIRDPKNRKRYKASTDTCSGKFADTRYRCIACYGPYSLLRLSLKTGRTHQIRVHLKFIGCPILGDPIYGRATKNTPFSDSSLMLHSFMLKIKLPGESRMTSFKAPVPKRFKKVLKVLHALYTKNVIPRDPNE
jgi:23S rRNA pseudouridine1911/1915/1917 synthase